MAFPVFLLVNVMHRLFGGVLDLLQIQPGRRSGVSGREIGSG